MDEERKITPVEVQRYLQGVNYPATKDDLIDAVQDNDADQDVFSLIDRLPDREYQSPADVSAELGRIE